MGKTGRYTLRAGELFRTAAVLQPSFSTIGRTWRILAVTVFLAASAYGQFPKTNVEILREAVWGLVDRSMDPCGLDRGDTVSVSFGGGSGALALFTENAYLEGLQDRGIHVLVAEDTAGTIRSLELVFPAATVMYPRGGREGLLGKRWFDRQALVRLSLRAVEAKTRRLLYAGNLEERIADRIPWSAIDQVEGDALIGQPMRPEMTGPGRWVEPVAAVGMFLGVASLFYFIRSG